MIKETPENKILTVTPVEEIKAKANEIIHEGRIVELPSGICVRLARPSLAVMLKNGTIPSNLVSAATRQMEGKGLMNPSQINDSIRVVELIVVNSVKEPKVVIDNPAEGQLSVNDFTDNDRGFIFNYVQTGSESLENFRSK